MTDTFNSDQENVGTTSPVNEQYADRATLSEPDGGTKLQQQIEVMQKRIGDKDTHISTIESENQTLREKLAAIDEKLNKMTTVEEALERIKDNNKSNQDTALDEDTLKSVMRGVLPSVMAEQTASQKAEANFKEVAAQLTKLYGKDKVDETVARIAEENGITFDDMLDLARKSPKVVYRMAGVTLSQTSATGFTPSHSTNTGYNDVNETRDDKLAYYAKLRREDPKTYFSPAVQKKFREVCLSK